MPVQSLLDRQHNTCGRHRHRQPSNGGGITPFWNASKKLAAATATATATTTAAATAK
jgi:hypothetical protein